MMHHSYQGKLSGPLLDRIDMQIEVPALPPAELAGAATGEPSAAVRARVAAARDRQLQRQGGLNATLSGDAIDTHCQLDLATAAFLQTTAAKLAWSARSYHRVLRMARTLADLEGAPTIATPHIAEAIQFRRVL